MQSHNIGVCTTTINSKASTTRRSIRKYYTFSKKEIETSLNENYAFFRNLAHYIIPPYNLARYHGKQQLLGNLIKYESNAIKSQEACGVSNRLISRPQTKGGPGLVYA